MRYALLLCTLLMALSGSAHAQPQRAVVEGIGRTDDDARDDALQRTLDTFIAHLRSQNPPIVSWSPSRENLAQYIKASVPGDPRETPDGSYARTWIVTLNYPDLARLHQWDNQAERGRSAFFAALIVIGGVGLGTGACWFWERRAPHGA